MKFNLTNIDEFSDIGTIVYYLERPFLDLVSVEGGKSMYSTRIDSDLSDFALSGFLFPRNSPEVLLPNLFDYQETKEATGTPYFDKIVSHAFPGGVKKGGEGEPHFFGRLKDSGDRVAYLSHLPKKVWKVEVYSSKLTENYEGMFVDCDILEELGIEPSETPILSIYFGPLQNTRIQDITYEELQRGEFPEYLRRYPTLDKRTYDSFEEVMTRGEYLESYREEVLSEKILYLVNNTEEGKLEEINFFPMSYPVSKNPHPHMPKTVLRNDELWREDFKITSGDDIILDSRSDVVLGLKKLTPNESSWFVGSLESSLKYSPSSSSTIVKVGGKVWNTPGRGPVFGENPEISPWWYCKDYLPKSNFKYFYVTLKGKGKISPNGLVYLGPDKPLRINVKPEKGYRYSEVLNAFQGDVTEKDGVVSINPGRYEKGHKFEVFFSEILYKLSLTFVCHYDYPRNGGKTSTYTQDNLEGLKVIYLGKDGREEVYSKDSPPMISDTQDLYFRLDFSDSLYELQGNLSYEGGEEVEISEEGWFKIKSLGGDDEVIAISGRVSSKKYLVTITAPSGVQVSTPKKNLLEYHNMDFRGTSKPFISRMTLNPGNTIEVNTKGDEGSWELIREEGETWIFKVPQIENDYEIIIK